MARPILPEQFLIQEGLEERHQEDQELAIIAELTRKEYEEDEKYLNELLHAEILERLNRIPENVNPFWSPFKFKWPVSGWGAGLLLTFFVIVL